MHISYMSAFHGRENVSGISGGFLVSLLLMFHLLKTFETQDFEMALKCVDNKELLQTWY
jgi:hypothetical protein